MPNDHLGSPIKRKKILPFMSRLFFSILLLFITSPLLAAFCFNCGIELPESANYCPSCGTYVANSLKTAKKDHEPQKSTQTKEKTISAKTKSADNAENEENLTKVKILAAGEVYQAKPEVAAKLLAELHPINMLEKAIAETLPLQDLTSKKEICEQNMKLLEQNKSAYSGAELTLLELHKGKLEILSLWIKNLSLKNEAQRKAETEKAIFASGEINKAIDNFLMSELNFEAGKKSEKHLLKVKKSTEPYKITAGRFRLPDGKRIKKGQPVWVIGISGSSVKIMHLGESSYPDPMITSLSVYDLQRRSNWRSNENFFYELPKGSESDKILDKPLPETYIKAVTAWEKKYPYRFEDKSEESGFRYSAVKPSYL